MYKELTICLIIIIAIVVGNNNTQEYTKKATSELSSNLNQLKEEILQEDEEVNWEEAQIEFDRINDMWTEKYDKMAYYIEHNELEKVESNLTGLKSYIKKQDSPEALNQLENGIFILKHIQEKNALDLKNIF